MSIFFRKTTKSNKGFSLIEVLIAIAIIGLAIPPLMLVMMKQADSAGMLRDRAMATWLAENTLNRLRLERQLSGAFLRSTLDEKIDMAGIEWLVVTEPEETTFGAVLRYRTTVSRDNEDPLISLDTFIH